MTSLELKANALHALLSGASAALDDPRINKDLEFCHVINLKLDGGILESVGTNRYVMAVGSLNVLPLGGGVSGNANLNQATIKAMLTMLKPLKDNAVTLTYDHGVILKSGDKISAFDHVALSYPNYSQLPLFKGDTAGQPSGESVRIDPSVLDKVTKVTDTPLDMAVNGDTRGVEFHGVDSHGITWRIAAMPIRKG